MEDYNPAWLEEAMEIAVKAEKRNLRYVEGILRRWRTEGRGPAGPPRNAGEATTVVTGSVQIDFSSI
ncbi:MAG: hypothetical protein KatS3mg051_1046 [Anaerolineae bacterium]|nr:MAG: hypothetical protein KatS3mg051_1046 [Anaerolineae bacterium]